MLGLQDPTIVAAYVLCFLSAVICVVWGAVNWNRGDEDVAEEDVKWAENEDAAEENV